MLRKQGGVFLLALVVFIAYFLFLFLFPHPADASTGINQELSFEGKIVTAAGINIPDGTYNMEFKIYSGGTATGGGTLEWTEDWLVSAGQGVTFTSGTFQVNLGTVNPFAAQVNWNSYPLYLSLQIGSTTSCTPAGNFTSNCGGDGEMSPYILLTSTPYAFDANELGGLASTAYGQLATTQTWTGENVFQPTTNIASAQVIQTSAASPTADIFDVQTYNNTNVLQITGPSQNTAAVNISSVGGTSAITLNAAGAINLTAAAASLFTTGTHTLAITSSNFNVGANGLVTLTGGLNPDITTAAGATATALGLQPGSSNAGSGIGAALTLAGGGQTGTTSTGGAVNINGGIGTTTNGAININNNVNAITNINTGTSTGAVNIGNGSAGAIALQSGSTVALTGTDFTLGSNGLVTLNGSLSPDITTPSAATANGLDIASGSSSAASGTGAALTLTGGNQTGTGGTAGAVTITGGTANGASGTRIGGAVNINGGIGTTTNGAININNNVNAITNINTGTSTGAVNIGNGSAGAIALQSGSTISITSGTGSNLSLDTGSNTGDIVLGATNAPVILIGQNSNTTSNSTQHLLQLNSVFTFAEAASCSTSTNQGALYYNNSTNTVRACLNGTWQDLVSTQDLGLLLFGVVPNSGNNPGDLIGASATAVAGSNTGGPCRVNFDSAASGNSSVYVNSCLAYSGGRQVSVPATLVSLSGVAANSYEDICLNSSGVPALEGGANTVSGSETFDNLTTTNAATYGQPYLCLATILTTATAGTLSKIYDLRTYTTTNKTYATDVTANNAYLGSVMTPSATAGEVVAATSATGLVQGVVVASSGAAGTLGAPNLILAISGPQWVFASSGTVNDNIIPGTTAGVATGATAVALTNNDNLGLNLNTYATSCTAQTFGATDCNYADFAYLTIQ